MKKIINMVLSVVAVAAASFGGYKAHGAYVAANMSEEDKILAENVEALSHTESAEIYRKEFYDCKYPVYGPANKARTVNSYYGDQKVHFNYAGYGEYVLINGKVTCIVASKKGVACEPSSCPKDVHLRVYQY
jgi:hypothetical protein